MGFGCPGGDVQPQGLLQVFLNLCEFEMNLQQAIEAPRVMSWNYPNSFAPHLYDPGRVDIECRVPADTRNGIREMGHVGEDIDDYSPAASCVHAVSIDLESKVVAAGADPRVEGAAIAW
jgi:gamma-glutamyltranspeptidase/glutathione hydrolase